MHKIKFAKGRFSPHKTYIRYKRGSGQVRVDLNVSVKMHFFCFIFFLVGRGSGCRESGWM